MSTIGAYGAIPFEFPVAAISADFAIPLDVTMSTVAADLTPVSPHSVIAIRVAIGWLGVGLGPCFQTKMLFVSLSTPRGPVYSLPPPPGT